MAVAIGASEAVVMAAAAAYPDGMDEYDLAGGLQQRLLNSFRCQTVNLEVPAHSEIVIEGFIQPGGRVQDGPYFDYTGTTNTNPNAFLLKLHSSCFETIRFFAGPRSECQAQRIINSSPSR
jgi:UbiD family decarboxylase